MDRRARAGRKAARALILAGIPIAVGVLLTTPRGTAAPTTSTARTPYCSPLAMAVSPKGDVAYVTDVTGRRLIVVDPVGGSVKRTIPLTGQPADVSVLGEEGRVVVSEFDGRSTILIDARTARLSRRLHVGAPPWGIAWLPRSQRCYLARPFLNDVVEIDHRTGAIVATVPVTREPRCLAATPDESQLVVGNFLPLGDGTDPNLAAEISLIETATNRVAHRVRLPGGATCVSGLCVSPEGRWAYVVHTIGRFTAPTTQLQRGWINTNALSIIDLSNRTRYATLLLDDLMRGAAAPWAVVCSSDGQRLWISLSGTHEVAAVDIGRLHALLDGRVPPELAQLPAEESLWAVIARSPGERAHLSDDLTALHQANAIRRFPSGGRGPRGLALTRDGKGVLVANFFSGRLTCLDTATGRLRWSVPLAEEPPPDPPRRGEMLFHDATICFQHWQSCASCHPDGRIDGLNWDLLNDGMGNPKNNKSLLDAWRTPPMMAHGVRADLDTAIIAGLNHILFCRADPNVVRDIRAYVRTLEAVPSPHRIEGNRLSDAAERGRRLFHDDRVGCAKCHPEPLYTDLKTYDVGTRGPLSSASEFDTPSLIELYRTAPYLHDGRAVTLRDVLTRFNAADKHGVTRHLTPQQIDDLVAFLMSL